MRTCLLITTYNRTAQLKRSLHRLAELTPPDEVLVVDDGGDDGCEEACALAEAELGLPMRYLYTHQPHVAMCSHARNVGIASTDCELVVTSEPEMLFRTDVLAQMRATRARRRLETEAEFHAPADEFINVGTVHHEQPPGSGGCHCGCGQEMHVTKNWQAPWVAMYARQWLLDVGGWDEDFPDPWGWDDIDLATRLRVAGIGQYNDLEIEAVHQWHAPHVVGQVPNEDYFRSKGFNGNESRDHPRIVANREAIAAGTWGIPKPRPS